jgi:hypothetical protein
MKKINILLLLILSVLVIGFLDFLTPYEYSLALLYFIPLIMAALRFSMRSIFAMATYAAIVWFAADYNTPGSPMDQYSIVALIWIGIIKIITLTVVGYTVMKTRNALAAKEMANQQLQKALHEIQELRDIIPVCSWCKSIRNDQGYYEKVEDYLSRITGADLSHTICPSCAKKLEAGFKS